MDSSAPTTGWGLHKKQKQMASVTLLIPEELISKNNSNIDTINEEILQEEISSYVKRQDIISDRMQKV